MKCNFLMAKRLKTISLNFDIQLSDELQDILNQYFVEVCDCFILKKIWSMCTHTEENLQSNIKFLQEVIVKEDKMRVEWDYNDICIFPLYAKEYILENSIIFTNLLLKQWRQKYSDKKLVIGINVTEDLDDCESLELTKLKILVECPSSFPFFDDIENEVSESSLLVVNSFDDLDLVSEVKKLQSQFIK